MYVKRAEVMEKEETKEMIMLSAKKGEKNIKLQRRPGVNAIRQTTTNEM